MGLRALRAAASVLPSKPEVRSPRWRRDGGGSSGVTDWASWCRLSQAASAGEVVGTLRGVVPGGEPAAVATQVWTRTGANTGRNARV